MTLVKNEYGLPIKQSKCQKVCYLFHSDHLVNEDRKPDLSGAFLLSVIYRHVSIAKTLFYQVVKSKVHKNSHFQKAKDFFLSFGDRLKGRWNLPNHQLARLLIIFLAKNAWSATLCSLFSAR